MTERLPYLRPDQLDPSQRELYDVFVNGPRQTQAGFFPVTDANGVLSGPYRAMLLSPAAGRPLEQVGRAVRYHIQLPDRIRELVILTVASLTDSDVEWRAHESLALAVGVPATTVASLRSATPLFEGEPDRLVHTFVDHLLSRHQVDQEVFEQVRARFGLDGLFEVIATAGYYQIIAHINNAFALDAGGERS